MMNDTMSTNCTDDMLITVFTPTYNRAALLSRLYESLCEQQFEDFEWLVVDDGSTDNTLDVINGYKEESKFPIRYFRQENGGKHRAINRGIDEARGELFFMVDSDDSLAPGALRIIANQYGDIRGKSQYGGISGCMSSHDGFLIDTILPGIKSDYVDCNSLDIRYKYMVVGDLAEVFRTSVLKEFRFPEFEGERFCPEALVWNRIAQKYILRYFKIVTYHRDYLPDGLTKRIVRIRMESPMASTTHYSELNSYAVPPVQKLKAAINYWRFWYCLRDKSMAPHLPAVWHLAKPLGWLMHRRDLRGLAVQSQR